MLPDNLYPVDSSLSFGVGYTIDQYTNEISAVVSIDATNQYKNLMSGYYLGWCKPENLPAAIRLSRYSSVYWTVYNPPREEDYDLVVLNIESLGTPSMNADVGFCVGTFDRNATTYYATWSNANTYGNNGTKTFTPFGYGSNSPVNLSYLRGCNNVYPEFWGVSRVRIYLRVFLNDPVSPNTYRGYQTITIEMTLIEWDKFKAGASTITRSMGNYGSLSFKGTDFVEGLADLTTTSGEQARVIFTGCLFPESYKYNAGSSTINIYPAILTHQKTTFSYDGTPMSSPTECFQGRAVFGYTDTSPTPCSVQTVYGNVIENNPYLGVAKDLTLTVGDLSRMTLNNITTEFDGYVIYRDSSVTGGCTPYPYYPLSMVDQLLGFMPRAIYNTSLPSYENVNLAPLVTSSNEFTGKTHTGFIGDPGFESTLRPWQYIDPLDTSAESNGTKNTNDYDMDDPDDKPEYDPEPSPEPGGDEGVNPENPDSDISTAGDIVPDSIESVEVGRTLPLGANKFITTYVLSQAELEEVGYNLWAGWSDTTIEFYKNWVTVFSDTGTFDLSRVYDMIVSLRYYPFEIPLDYFVSAPCLTMGSGHTRIIDRAVKITKVLALTINCGTCAIPKRFLLDKQSADFRCYTNATIIVYLPFCGTVELNPADVVGHTIACKYHVDLTSGGCTAAIYLQRSGAETMIATKTGSIGILMPISATNAGQVTGQFLSDASNIVQTIGTTIVSLATSKAAGAVEVPTSSNSDIAARQAAQQEISGIQRQGKVAQQGVNTSSGILGSAGNAMMRSGCAYSAMGGGVGASSYTMPIEPYVVMRNSQWASPNKYHHDNGYLSTSCIEIGSHKGFNQFKNPDLSGVNATAEELTLIKSCLEHGIYIK